MCTEERRTSDLELLCLYGTNVYQRLCHTTARGGTDLDASRSWVESAAVSSLTLLCMVPR